MTSGFYVPFPGSFCRNPVVLLDSGRSVAESVFLERWRKDILETLDRTGRHSVWILYPDGHQWARHGAFPMGQYEEWEIRPVRRGRQLEAAGFFATVACFEEGCFHLRIKAPWRENQPEPRRRAVTVYLSPSAQDLRWLVSHDGVWQKPSNMPELHIGTPWNRRLNAAAADISETLWCFDQKAQTELNRAYAANKAWRVGWPSWWKAPGPNAARITVAHGWRDQGTQRHQDTAARMAQEWIRQGLMPGLQVHAPADDGRWQTLDEATDCRVYFILTKAEPEIPFDALIALSRGAMLIAPDAGPFRLLPGNKLLYPVRSNHDGTRYDAQFGETAAAIGRALRRTVHAAA